MTRQPITLPRPRQSTVEAGSPSSPHPQTLLAVPTSQLATPRETKSDSGKTHTCAEDAEFYGPTGTFYFLSQLRSHAGVLKSPRSSEREGQDPASGANPSSVVHLMRSAEYSHDDTRSSIDLSSPQQPSQKESLATWGPECPTRSHEIKIERECIRLYFQNLHCIHPIINQSLFLQQCEHEIWPDATGEPASRLDRKKLSFLALFYIVLAIGAITAGDTSLLVWEDTIRILNEAEKKQSMETAEGSDIFPPIRAARLFFHKSKDCMGDVFETSSLESAQTLFLMVRRGQGGLAENLGVLC